MAEVVGVPKRVLRAFPRRRAESKQRQEDAIEALVSLSGLTARRWTFEARLALLEGPGR